MEKDSVKTISELYTEGFRRLHIIVPLALLMPLSALIPISGMEAGAAAAADRRLAVIYLLSLLLAVPGALMHLAQARISRFFLFLLTCTALLVCTMAGMYGLGTLTGLTMQGSVYPPALLVLLLFLFDAMSVRYNENSRIRSKREGDLSWTQESKLLPGPSWFVFVCILAVYILSMFAHSRGLGNAALTAAVLYFFMFIPYLMFRGREQYLGNRKHVKGVPAGRIHSLKNRQLLGLLIPAGLFAAGAVLTAGGRQFLDMPSFGGMPDESAVSYGAMGTQYLMEELMRMLGEDAGAPPPAWLEYLLTFIENVVSVFCIGLAVYIALRLLMSAARKFRGIEKEAGEVYRWGDSDEHISLRPSSFSWSVRLSGIRRRYKKTILQYRGEAPGISETPAQIERLAGLPDTEQMKSLHAEYEKARYGRD